MKLLLLLSLLAVAPLSLCTSNSRVLVLLDNLSTKESHSSFFRSLSEQGFVLTYRLADESGLLLKQYGEFVFDHLIVFSPSVEEFGGLVSVDAITEFVDSGAGNVLVAVSDKSSETMRELATEFGFETDDDSHLVIDHVNYDEALDNVYNGKHTVIKADPKKDLIKAETIVGDVSKLNPIVYRGTGLIVDAGNELVLPIMKASSTSYSYHPDEVVTSFPHAVGKNTVLVAGMQARNNARVVFSGSLDLFSDAFINYVSKDGKSGNGDLVLNLANWCFKRSGVLRHSNVRHSRVGETTPPETYTITDEVRYSINIEHLVNGKWVPFRADDVQLEFVRIDPFIRQTLKFNEATKGMEATFKIPDVYGVYQFKINYDRVGLTRLNSVTQVSVRPWRHDQYERFIPAAFPYYASAFSMMVGVSLLAIVVLHGRDDVSKGKKDQ